MSSTLLYCAGHEKTPRSWPCRLVCLSAHLTAVVLLAAYSATFISFLAVRRSSLPFTTFEEMLNDGTYQLGIMDNSVELNFFDVSINLAKQRLARYTPKYNQPQSTNHSPSGGCFDKYQTV